MKRGLTEYLADFITSVSFEDIPGEAIQNAKNAILDFIGVAVAGSRTLNAEIIINHVKELHENPVANGTKENSES